ncbi:glutathione peroxidase [Vitreimonas sp.]|uniref:glutathione peroxidase n=1 Tax=Vitreimonas sp. TaxID=3069702 RepID=UPI002ED7A835
MTSIYDFTARDIDGKERSLSEYRGKVLLIVNTASQCGFTYQYKGLEELHRKYAAQGVEVLGFPCNQFGKQEPGDADEIKNFCSLTYNVTFPMFAKIDVNGPNAHPLYKYLTESKRGFLSTKNIKWNFTKFLIDREGRVRGRFGPTTKPEALDSVIARAL